MVPPRWIYVDKIVGLSEMAERLKWDSSTVANWAKRYDDFPEPIRQLHAGKFYDWEEILKWAIAHGKR
jgi:hypothetical protein